MNYMKNAMLVCFILIICSATAFAASNAFIVGDTTAPQGQRSLRIESQNAGEGAKYTVQLEPKKQYTLSFWYKSIQEDFGFLIEDENSDEIISGTNYSKTNWNYVYKTFNTDTYEDPIEVDLLFQAGHGNAKWFLDAIQLEPSPEPTKFADFEYQQGCCPFDFCYTGGAHPVHPSCIHDDFYEKNATEPPLGFSLPDFGTDADTRLLNAANGYRCINGSWKFSRAKFSPVFDHAGFCPEDTQCFLYQEDNVDPADVCKPHGTFHPYNRGNEVDYYYCYNGNWTTRTKEIALQLLEMANETDQPYTIFCDKFDRSLNADQTMSYWRDYIGESDPYIGVLLASGLTNEFCVLRLEGQVIAGVSLNHEINQTLSYDPNNANTCVPGGIYCLNDDSNCDHNGCIQGVMPTYIPLEKSFLDMLKGPEKNDYCDNAMDKDGEYHACQNKDVYYNAKLQNVIFTKPQQTGPGQYQSVPMPSPKNFFERAFDYIRSLVRSLLGIGGIVNYASEELTAAQYSFIESAGSFDRLFISMDQEGPNGFPREIKGIMESRAFRKLDNSMEVRTFINIDYLNYQVPVCDYFQFKALDHLKRQISDINNYGDIKCAPVILDDQQWKYSVFVLKPRFGDIDPGDTDVREWSGAADNFWNDMTAKIRTGAVSEYPDDEPDLPEFNYTPQDNPVVGTELSFSLLTPPPEGQHYIAITWDFNDSKMVSGIYNLTTTHTYDEAKEYTPKVRVMNQYYQIAEYELDPPLDVLVGPSLVVDQTSPQSTSKQLYVEIDFGEFVNYNLSCQIDWDDSKNALDEPEWFNDIDEDFSASHLYTMGSSNIIDPMVNVTCVDRDGVSFHNHKRFVVYNNIPSP